MQFVNAETTCFWEINVVLISSQANQLTELRHGEQLQFIDRQMAQLALSGTIT